MFKDKTSQLPKTLREIVDAALPDLAAKWDESLEMKVAVQASDYIKDSNFSPAMFWKEVSDTLLARKEPVTIQPGGERDAGNTAYLVYYSHPKPRS